ncbi:hypothetical protein B0H15DRAFT_158012 [Mycena belliarum]|uniref:F-box domain-containing protein n=1 Tax=Mycena belliarum TaxID=1033014 RepID=A0AAD6U734_9AGAR|nr:hypothetical protein B0H15DRAFT_158012 [Mycena belliae]
MDHTHPVSSPTGVNKRRRSESLEEGPAAKRRAGSAPTGTSRAVSASGQGNDIPPRKRRRSESPGEVQDPPAKRFAVAAPPESRRSPSVVTRASPALPTEILQMIFEFALPPQNLLRVSASDSKTLNPAWRQSLSDKAAIVLVSRDWYYSGSPFLYRHVKLTDVRHIDALYQTLTAKPYLGGFVRCISFMSSIEIELFREDTPHEDMARIFELCPALTRVNDLPPPRVCSADPYDQALYPATPFPTLPPTVTALRIGPHRALPEILDILRESCSRLEVLSIDVRDCGTLDIPLTFPRLRTLCLETATAVPKLNNWTMPQLRHLSFRAHPRNARRPASRRPNYIPFVSRHGRDLSYLALPPAPPAPAPAPALAPALAPAPAPALPHAPAPAPVPELGRLLALCPHLTHVVLPSRCTFAPVHKLPPIEAVDLWDDAPPIAGLPAGLDDAEGPGPDGPCCSITRVRVLDPALARVINDPARATGLDAPGDWSWAVVPGLVLAQEERLYVGYLTLAQAAVDDAKTTTNADGWEVPEFERIVVYETAHEQLLRRVQESRTPGLAGVNQAMYEFRLREAEPE